MKLGTGFCSGVNTIIVFDCDSKNVGIITSLSALNKLNKLYMLFSVHYYEILGGAVILTTSNDISLNLKILKGFYNNVKKYSKNFLE